MAHQALYRRFRSRTFDEVIGQEHVTKTLKNQIMSNNIAHAYLFCGIRGTGKTSIAKIFSRAVNCLNNTDGNPCNECEVCKGILDNSNIDVVEMDAASNNGVDDIRELRDKVMFLPSKCKYKVYIIDEVHMLSKGAFNALLKTLEEPPKHLIFILATTEPQKIPATILSRCQRFDLRRFTIEEIVNHMQDICKEINVETEEKALKLIAANADGAMRDALSILDRCLTFDNTKVSYDDVNELLGIVSVENVMKISNAIVDKNIKETMVLLDENLSRGKDLLLFIEEIITYFRNVLMYKTTNTSDNLLRMTDDNIEVLKKYAEKVTIDQVIDIIQSLSQTLADCKRATNPRIIFETKLISIMEEHTNVASSNSTNASSGANNELINTLLKRIENLERIINSGQVINNINNSANNDLGRKNISQRPTTRAKEPEKSVAQNNQGAKNPQAEHKEVVLDGDMTDDLAFEKLSSNWNQFLKLIRSENAGLFAIIRESKISHVANNTVYFEYESKFNFHYTAANQEKNKTKLKEILLNFLRADYKAEFRLVSENSQQNPPKSMDDVFEDMKNAFGDDKVELK